MDGVAALEADGATVEAVGAALEVEGLALEAGVAASEAVEGAGVDSVVLVGGESGPCDVCGSEAGGVDWGCDTDLAGWELDAAGMLDVVVVGTVALELGPELAVLLLWAVGPWAVVAWAVGAWAVGAWAVGAWAVGAWAVGAWVIGAWAIGAWTVGAWAIGAGA